MLENVKKEIVYLINLEEKNFHLIKLKSGLFGMNYFLFSFLFSSNTYIVLFFKNLYNKACK